MSTLDLERDSEAEEVARKLLDQARQAGCRVAIDDRGELVLDGPIAEQLGRLLQAHKSAVEIVLSEDHGA